MSSTGIHNAAVSFSNKVSALLNHSNVDPEIKEVLKSFANEVTRLAEEIANEVD